MAHYVPGLENEEDRPEGQEYIPLQHGYDQRGKSVQHKPICRPKPKPIHKAIHKRNDIQEPLPSFDIATVFHETFDTNNTIRSDINPLYPGWMNEKELTKQEYKESREILNTLSFHLCSKMLYLLINVYIKCSRVGIIRFDSLCLAISLARVLTMNHPLKFKDKTNKQAYDELALQLHHMQETRINLATAGLTKEEAKLIRKMWNDIITRGTWKVSRTLDFGDKLWVQAKQLCNERTQESGSIKNLPATLEYILADLPDISGKDINELQLIKKIAMMDLIFENYGEIFDSHKRLGQWLKRDRNFGLLMIAMKYKREVYFETIKSNKIITKFISSYKQIFSRTMIDHKKKAREPLPEEVGGLSDDELVEID